ncbi:MAG: hypothetical protein AB8B61_10025 [Cyclobacteriaceae bacterium]
MKKIIASIILLAIGQNLFPCDACNFLEYGNLQNQHYASISYKHRSLNGYNTGVQTNQFSLNGSGNFANAHVVQGANDSIYFTQEDEEAFRSIELRLNFNLKNNWNILAILPYNTHKVYFKKIIRNKKLGSLVSPQEDSTNTIKGLGDVSVYLEKYWIVKKGDWKAYLRFSPGIQIPTGKTDASEGSFVFDPVVQPGMGVFNAMLRTNNTLIYRARFGGNIGFNYAKSLGKVENTGLNTNTVGNLVPEYEFGDRVNGQLNVFYITNFYNYTQWIPTVGLYYENVQANKENGEELTTGGSVLFQQIGLEMMHNQFSVQAQFSLPILQDMNGVQIENAGMFTLSGVYRFGKKEEGEIVNP